MGRGLSCVLQSSFYKSHFIEWGVGGGEGGCLPSYCLSFALIPSLLLYFAYNSLSPEFLRENGCTRQDLIISGSLSIMPSVLCQNLTSTLNITEDNQTGKLTSFCLLYKQLCFLIYLDFRTHEKMTQFHKIDSRKYCLLATDPPSRIGSDFEISAVEGDSNAKVFMLTFLSHVQ